MGILASLSSRDMRVLLKEWADHIEEMSGLSMLDDDVRSRLLRQVRVVRDLLAQEVLLDKEDEYDVWRRIVKQSSEGKAVDMVDMHRINIYMERQRDHIKAKPALPAQGGEPTGKPAPPAVPRREEGR